ncbi:MAG: S8 family serine peptidase [Bacteroidota bacterium]
MDPILQEQLFRGNPSDEMEVILKLRSDQILPKQTRIISRFGEIATCRIPRTSIHDLWSHPNVEDVQACRHVTLEESNSVPSSARLAGGSSAFASKRKKPFDFSGKGVVLGIIDKGFDPTHPDFIDPSGSSRFLAMWDQSSTLGNNSYGYGRMFFQKELNAAIRSRQPFQTLAYHPAWFDPGQMGSHGTHTCGIAAGNGRTGPMGVAPDVEIVAVNLSLGRTGKQISLGNSVRLLEAIDFISKVAGNQPLVISCSIGLHAGDHKGASLFEQAIDYWLQERKARACVMSCGNYFLSNTHQSGKLRQGEQQRISWVVRPRDRTPNELELWYSSQDELEIAVCLPNSKQCFRVLPQTRKTLILHGQKIGSLYHRLDPNTQDNQVVCYLYPHAPAGRWNLQLFAKDIQQGGYHAYIEKDSPLGNDQSFFPQSEANPLFTTGSICNGFLSIAVGAVDSHSKGFKLAPFSSAGPTADFRVKPEICAEGMNVPGPKSAGKGMVRSTGEHTLKSGTSMACPHVAGAIALLFEATPRPLHIQETRELLFSSTLKPEIISRLDRYRYGYGVLDIEKALEQINTTALSKRQ